MNKLRHDLTTSGWSSFDQQHWVDRLRDPNANINTLREYMDEIIWLLHEALPDETFYGHSFEWRDKQYDQPLNWHFDGGYLRLILTCHGDSTLVAHSFENNIMISPGYALILSGDERHALKGVPVTWHATPPAYKDRKVFVANFDTVPPAQRIVYGSDLTNGLQFVKREGRSIFFLSW
jgi:hypothetical protein